MAAALGVSATPVREAMVDLITEGMVTSVKNKGYRITAVSESELDELAQLRTLIEAPTVRQIAAGPDLTDEVQHRLNAAAARIVAAARGGDLLAYLRADRDFHAELLTQFGNQQLVGLATGLRAKTRMYGLRDLAADELVASSLEHQQLLDLVVAKDAAGAEELMRRHIGHSRGVWAGPAAADPLLTADGQSQ